MLQMKCVLLPVLLTSETKPSLHTIM